MRLPPELTRQDLKQAFHMRPPPKVTRQASNIGVSMRFVLDFLRKSVASERTYHAALQAVLQSMPPLAADTPVSLTWKCCKLTIPSASAM